MPKSFTFSQVTVITLTKKTSEETVALLDGNALTLYDPRSGMVTFSDKQGRKADLRGFFENEFSDDDNPLQEMRLKTFSHDNEAAFEDVFTHWKYDFDAMPTSIQESVLLVGPQLSSYEFWKAELNQKALKKFVQLAPQLTSLSFCGCKIGGHNLTHLQPLKITTLAFQECTFEAGNVHDLAKFPALQRVSIDKVQDIAELLKALVQLKGLQRIHFSEKYDAGKTNEAAEKLLQFAKGAERKLLSQFPALQEITFASFNAFAKEVTDLQAHFEKKFPNLKVHKKAEF